VILLELTVKCNGCGAFLTQTTNVGSISGFKTGFLALKKLCKMNNVMVNERYMRSTQHFCQPCADGPTRTNGKKMKKAFTLIEFMIVVVIVGIIAAIVIPGFSKARKQDAERGPVAVRISRFNSVLDEYEYDGHRYLSGGHGIIHAEHCPCRTNGFSGLKTINLPPEVGAITPEQLPPMWDIFGNRIQFTQLGRWNLIIYTNVDGPLMMTNVIATTNTPLPRPNDLPL
jgi:prepilin-type N-terminal cleavage/methylation domain-containing protein